MQNSTKVWASVSGVCIATAVVVGAVLGAAGNGSGSHQQHPAGNVGGAAPVTVTTTVSAPATSASPAATVVAKVSPSTSKPAAKKRQAVVRQQQEAPVTDPAPTSDPQPPASDPASTPANVDPIHGGPLRHGPTDAPSSWVAGPDDPISPLPKEQH